jgi:hypothetical protein
MMAIKFLDFPHRGEVFLLLGLSPVTVNGGKVPRAKVVALKNFPRRGTVVRIIAGMSPSLFLLLGCPMDLLPGPM